MLNKILFFGSGPVAAESLRLLAKDFDIEAVVTKSTAPHHRGEVPVLRVAEELQLPVLTAANKDELDKLFRAKPVTSGVAILIDFGIIVSQTVIDYFPLGIINSHFSLLPQWRGADPISFAVLSGQKQTGVSLMLLVAAMDEGPLLAHADYDLSPDITTPELTAGLIELSAHSLRSVVPKYVAGELKAVPQSVTGREVSYSRKLTKADGILDWHKPAVRLEREVRAFAGWPRSRTTLGDIEVIVTKAHVGGSKGAVGSLWRDGKQLGVYTSDGLFIIDSLIPAGKKEMDAGAFLAGYKI